MSDVKAVGQNVRVYTSLRDQINALMKFIRGVARVRDMPLEAKENARIAYIQLSDALWNTLIDLHCDGCACDDCLLARIAEDR